MRRAWWPFGDIPLTSNDTGVFFWIGFVWTALLVVAWPIWLSGKLLGVSPWTVNVRRKGKIVRSEKVKGLDESGQRIREIADELRPPAPPDGEPASGAIVY